MRRQPRCSCSGIGAALGVVVACCASHTVYAETRDADGSSSGSEHGSRWRSLVAIRRSIPRVLPNRPGNVFLVGEPVVVPVPKGIAQKTKRWRAVDDRKNVVAQGSLVEGKGAELGKLPIGWLRVEFLDGNGTQTGWTTAAILSPLAESVPQDSPICVDSATAWFARNDAVKQEQFTQLTALAGANWIRDRMSWGELERAPGQFAKTTTYDTSASLAARFGLKALQVFHSTPKWALDANMDGDAARQRFPRDLRALYRFCKAMVERYRGRVLAWEPWNEANIRPFGGHTIDEMCAFQKAAYLAFKAGDPNVVVCWNVFAGAGRAVEAEGVIENETWPYFETFNIHSYHQPRGYLRQFEHAREAACGRPMWITECGVRLRYQTEDPRGDLSFDDEMRQAEFIARSYASSLFAGVNRHFFFILGNYLERGVQFGLLRHDLTPRPGYAAFAAVGRLLAGARCLGCVPTTMASGASIYAFRARPDGVPCDVLVAWSHSRRPWPLKADLKIRAVHDYLGRSLGRQLPREIGTAAVFVLLPPGESSKRVELETPPEVSAYRQGAVSPVVMQLNVPVGTRRLEDQAHEIKPDKKTELPIFVYNFGRQRVSGTVGVEQAPRGWAVELERERIELGPLERKCVRLHVTMPAVGLKSLKGAWIKLRGDFNSAGRPALAFRLIGGATALKPSVTMPLTNADRPSRWEDNIVHGATMTHGPFQPKGVLFDMTFGKADPWSYPRFRLQPDEIPTGDVDGLALTVQVLEGKGVLRVQFVEDGGAAYLTGLAVDPNNRRPQRTVALFHSAVWGGHSRPDPDGKLQPRNIRAVLVGINSERNSKVRMVVSNLEWVKF